MGVCHIVYKSQKKGRKGKVMAGLLCSMRPIVIVRPAVIFLYVVALGAMIYVLLGENVTSEKLAIVVGLYTIPKMIDLIALRLQEHLL